MSGAASGAAEHIVRSFEVELNRLRGMLSEMGGLVEDQVASACRAVIDKDGDAGSRAVETDPSVDAMEYEIEQFAIRLLALRQPMAQDLRLIVAAFKISGDLERIGDYAANVAKRSIVLQQFMFPAAVTGLENMSRLVQESLKAIIDAVGENDTGRALEIWNSDERIDEIYNSLFRELVTYMMEDPRNISPCTHLLFIAKNLERIGDHATNIAENLYYAVTGEPLTGMRPKGDQSAFAVVRPAADVR